MSHFYGTLDGQAGRTTRCGSKKSGYKAVAASYQGAIEVLLGYDQKSGQDIAIVRFVPWHGNGGGPDCALPYNGFGCTGTLLYSGPVNPTESDLLTGITNRLAGTLIQSR